MADRRGVRPSSRRKTPTPQPPHTAPPAPPARAPRGRALRSASRDVDDVVDVQKVTRRSARHASVATVTTVTDDSEVEGKAARRTRRKPAKQALRDLPTVEELDTTQTAVEELNEAPGTPTQLQAEIPMPFLSPGAVSEMSGTTAISSFSMVEAEFLEPKYILKHLRKLCDSTEEFLEHLAPYGADMTEDLKNIDELQKPDSDFNVEFRDFDAEFNVHLRHYKNEEHAYIHIRALHRALFGPNRDVAAAQSGLDLILYLTNLLVFVKQTIYSDRRSKDTWDALRQLDNSFPSHFMRSLIAGATPTAAGESSLFVETFKLALELRTQLAIMVLARQGNDDEPADVINEVFMRSEVSQAADSLFIRGWSIPALGGDDPLPQELEAQVISRCNEIADLLAVRDRSRDERVALLEEQFPWEPTILRLLHWVRLRHRELTTAIEERGGAAAIVRSVKQAMEELEPAGDGAEIVQAGPDVPRRKRKSFGRDRRRSGRKFDPNAPLDLHIIDALKARERISGARSNVGIIPQNEEANILEPTIEDDQEDLPLIRNEQDEWQPVPEAQEIEEVEDRAVDPFAEGNDNVTLVAESQPDPQEEQEPAPKQIEEMEDAVERPVANGPPQSSADILAALKEVSKLQKENRPQRTFFDRQETAQRVEFEDGFGDSQPTAGPSNTGKGKQSVQPSTKKRPRSVGLDDDDSEEEGFETHERGSRVQQQRQKAPAAKRVRIDPSSSGAPPSHQPPPRHTKDDDYQPPRRTQIHDDSISDEDAPEMTEIPPPSSYQAQHFLAQQNRRHQATGRTRKPREAWSHAEEEAFMKYMGMFPAQYAQILNHDLTAGQRVLQERTQVNLKDKARTMATNMIKSGTGLRPGFENVIRVSNKYGRDLVAQGYSW
ncbi:hypothetical protein T440DRAFT_420966 [Plenodomus tracheiphilus IPT5]|uniref:Myb-like domain-containing protein n=1 Tax=Plenodomus tracheiphilus IPT5 TaxID=1408161 RepID=A0A6A7B9V1_9PLEO|nr:hypothetical protein T440DRAFT_420966 [Plenodomus tracheiphilus IPT5]